MRIVILLGGVSGLDFAVELTRLMRSYAHHPSTPLRATPTVAAVIPAPPDVSELEEAAPHMLTAHNALDAIMHANLILLAPCCPLEHIRKILHNPGIAHAIRSAPCPVLGISPIINGHAVPEVSIEDLSRRGVNCTATAIAEHYGARTYTSESGLLDGWIVDTTDQDTHVHGVSVRSVPLGEVREDGTARVRVTLALLGVVGAI